MAVSGSNPAIASLKFIDIGANLTDPMFKGIYHGSEKHQPDLEAVIKRAKDAGVEKIMVTGGSLKESQEALDLARTDSVFYCTVGCHPTRCQEFEGDPQDYLEKLTQLIVENRDKVVAVGECGLDYDRLEFCPADVQRKYFELQLSVAEKTGLPLFLHCRNAAQDLIEILTRNRERITTGVVHSFDGTKSEADAFIDLDFYIGINGCSVKTTENLDVVTSLPQNRIMIETDAPWCDIKGTSAAVGYVSTKPPTVNKPSQWKEGKHVKGRNEPDNVVQVFEVIARVMKMTDKADISELANTIYATTEKVFFETSKA